MPKTLSHALLQRLRKSPSLRQAFEDLVAMAGVESRLMDALGNECVRVPRGGGMPMHGVIGLSPALRDLAARALQERLGGREGGDPLPWRELVVRVRFEGEVVAYWVASAWRHPDCTVADLQRYWRGLAATGDPLRWVELRRAWEALPPGSREAEGAWRRWMDRQIHEVLHGPESAPGNLPRDERMTPLVRRAAETVRERAAGRLTLGEVAAVCGVSAEHLSREFRRVTGLRFGDYLAEVRVARVCDALRESPRPISEIAMEHGFSTLSRFNRAFREITGTTPRRWRRRAG